jgi:hypothetical protein
MIVLTHTTMAYIFECFVSCDYGGGCYGGGQKKSSKVLNLASGDILKSNIQVL